MLCDTGSPNLSDFTGSDHWVAALSQCFYPTSQKLGKKSVFSGLAKAFTEIAIQELFRSPLDSQRTWNIIRLQGFEVEETSCTPASAALSSQLFLAVIATSQFRFMHLCSCGTGHFAGYHIQQNINKTILQTIFHFSFHLTVWPLPISCCPERFQPLVCPLWMTSSGSYKEMVTTVRTEDRHCKNSY